MMVSSLLRLHETGKEAKWSLTLLCFLLGTRARQYNEPYNCVVSADEGGMLEYWKPEEPYDPPQGVWEFKSATDLYDFKKVS